ncbi:MAG: 1-deoxy-D-xylulose-5-phosphate synthase [Chitinophagaceae bacterium]|nr:1-deoxy-D-xylulose-5-phosphate synthase [Chitinophagaceae bacterium]
MKTYLSDIQSPLDLKEVPKELLSTICEELRQFIIHNVSQYGGHFGANLGTIELTVALHYVFNTPYDLLVWDVGHQAYGHKILTGRRDVFHTNRIYKGISGFPKRKESEYDAFGVGHSSTSLSAALGMAIASKYKKEFERQHIAVIGDGALTAGMAFEAMNHTGVSDSNLTIILNDNCMSIDPNVGALKNYLLDISTSQTYNKIKEDVWNTLGKFKKIGENTRDFITKVETSIKGLILQRSNYFESLNIRYFGPINGHDVLHLVDIFNDIKSINGPKILHCITVKGKGYGVAEQNQTVWHAPGKFDKITGVIHKKIFDTPQPPKYQDVFGHTIIELARENEKIVAITPAMPSGSSLNLMMKEFPDRCFDVGIAEQHAVTFSAGLATQGLIPFCNIYSSFMQRGYDQVIHDVCLQNLPVIFCLDRAGLVGEDGPTHHGNYDIAYMRCIPNIIVAAPMNEEELRNMMYTATFIKNSAFSIRYPRGQGVMPEWKTPIQLLEIGKGRCIREGKDIAFVSIGTAGNTIRKVCVMLQKENISVGHYDMRFVKPIDTEMLSLIFSQYKYIITVEDGCLPGGFGSAVLEVLAEMDYTCKVTRLGIPDRIVEHGEPEQLHFECGFDTQKIYETAQKIYASIPKPT